MKQLRLTKLGSPLATLPGDSAQLAYFFLMGELEDLIMPIEKPLMSFIGPAHKRTEGRAPAWGSEFSKEVATVQGDTAEISPRLNVTFWDSVVVLVLVLVVVVVVTGGELPPLKPNPLFKSI
jgi:hypothetical protein